MSNNDIVKDFYRKTKLIHKNDVKTIWQATHVYTGDVVIVKTQTLNEAANQRTLLHQGKFVQTCQGSPGIPFLLWCGKDQTHKQAILIEQKLGKTLKHIMADSQTNPLSLKSVMMIGIQLIKVISCYHEKGYIHRNINLDTIQFGVGSKCDKVYFNDFIQGRSFYKKGTLQHIDHKTGIKLKKATEFLSYDVLKGNEPSRKDDLESIMLVLICLLKSKLPWSDVWESSVINLNGIKNSQSKVHQYSEKQQFIKLKSEEKIRILNQKQGDLLSKKSQIYIQNDKVTGSLNFIDKHIKNLDKTDRKGAFCRLSYQEQLNQDDKGVFRQLLSQDSLKNGRLQKKVEQTIKIMQLFSASKLCESLPRQLLQIMSEIKSLEFTSKPNYLLYIQKLNAILIKNELQNDGIFDWMDHRTLAQSSTKGGLCIKHYEWLIKGDNSKGKLVEFENERQVMALYEKMAPFIEVDKLVTL